MSSTFFDINAQIDLGNLAVGIGTVLVAGASFYSIHKQSLINNSEARKEWTESLRSHLAEFISIQNGITLSSERKRLFRKGGDEQSAQNYVTESLKLSERATYLISYISLMIDKDNRDHLLLIECMQKSHEESVLNIKGRPTSEVEAQTKVLPDLLDQARIVLKHT